MRLSITKKTVPVICDTCRDALHDDMPESRHMPEAEMIRFMMENGSEIADHLCEKREEGNPCDCGCNGDMTRE